MSYNPFHKSFDLPVKCSEHRGEHCSCSEEHRKIHSRFTIKNAIEVIQALNRDEPKSLVQFISDSKLFWHPGAKKLHVNI